MAQLKLNQVEFEKESSKSYLKIMENQVCENFLKRAENLREFTKLYFKKKFNYQSIYSKSFFYLLLNLAS